MLRGGGVVAPGLLGAAFPGLPVSPPFWGFFGGMLIFGGCVMDVVEFSEVEAGANFAEVLRLVRAGRRVVVVCDGEAVAEVGLPRGQRAAGEGWHEYLARTGQLTVPGVKWDPLPGVRVEGALERFLEDRG